MSRGKKHKISKTIKDNYSAAKSYREPKHCLRKSVTIEHPKTSHELSKFIRYVEKVSGSFW